MVKQNNSKSSITFVPKKKTIKSRSDFRSIAAMFIYLILRIWHADVVKQIFSERRLKKNGDITFTISYTITSCF